MSDLARIIERAKVVQKYGISLNIQPEEIPIVLEALENQLRGKWIPVNKGLPEIEGLYEVTMQYDNFAGIYTTVRTARFAMSKHWDIHGPQPVVSNKKVTAWRPLPESYDSMAEEL